jgi:hypothetical protein
MEKRSLTECGVQYQAQSLLIDPVGDGCNAAGDAARNRAITESAYVTPSATGYHHGRRLDHQTSAGKHRPAWFGPLPASSAKNPVEHAPAAPADDLAAINTRHLEKINGH